MRTSIFISSSLLALATTVQSLTFTGPSSSKPVDLSKEITITWSADNSSEQKKWPTFDLAWYSQPTELHSFDFEIQSGLNSSDGEYKFTPGKNTIKTLLPFVDQLSANKSFSFRATLRNGTEAEDTGAVVSSDKYKVTGLQATTNAAAAVGLGWGFLACGITTISFMVL